MNRPELTTYPTEIVENNIPENHLGEKLSIGHAVNFVATEKPAEMGIYVVVGTLIRQDTQVFYKFITTKLFVLQNPVDHPSVLYATCDFAATAIHEHNLELEKIASSLTAGIKYQVPPFKELYPEVAAYYRKTFPDWVISAAILPFYKESGN